MSLRITSPLLLCVAALAPSGCGNQPTAHHEVDAGADAEPDAADTQPEAGACERSVGGDASVESIGLVINEAVSSNDGVWVDELGETDDWFELTNTSSAPIHLGRFSVVDSSGNAAQLPKLELGPGAHVVLWADDAPEQGALHLPFKLSAAGESLSLWSNSCSLVARVELPELLPNEAYGRFPGGTGEWSRCRYTSAGRDNGAACEPPPRPEIPVDVTFEPFEWPDPWPEVPTPLVLTELVLRPATAIEVLNTTSVDVELADYSLRLAPTAPGLPAASETDGVQLPWGSTTLGPGERLVVPVPSSATASLEATETFEGVVTVFHDGSAVDRVDFARFPEQAALARQPDEGGSWRFCTADSLGAENDTCDAVTGRETGDRVHRLATPGDFTALAAGGTDVGQEGVKFIIDMEAEDTVHLLRAEDWALHYTFIRERIYGEPPLDRCDAEQARLFNQGWVEFSQREYYQTEGRRFLLGTLVRHAGGAHTVEFTSGDAISPAQMRRAFFTVAARTQNPTDWAVRVTNSRQINIGRTLEGTLPLVSPNAPFRDVEYQPLSPSVGFGQLEFIPAAELETAPLGPRTIVLTDAVPNDIPFVGGLITEAFQTPLAHVNVLSQARGTPNMALKDARNHAELAPLLGELVRLEVGPSQFSVRTATASEADAFWQSQQTNRPSIDPEFDRSLRGIVALEGRGIEDLPALGAKAAQFAELYRIDTPHSGCLPSTAPLNVPRDAFAIPVAHSLDHFESSGAKALLEGLLADPEFRADPEAHQSGLAAVRRAILDHPVDPALLHEVTQAVESRFGSTRVRFRSSSNTEDLPEFNGAGLHTSISAEIGDPERRIEDALRTVWSSLWNTRAFDERDFARVTQLRSAMGVLVHAAHLGEAAQGVAISRNLLHVTRSDTYYINAQIGEATVTNPAPGVTTEELLYTWPPSSPSISYQGRSSLTEDRVLSDTDVRAVACATAAVHDHFQPLLDPNGDDRLFAMQIEYKVLRGTRDIVVKQARPQPFGAVTVPDDCREF